MKRLFLAITVVALSFTACNQKTETKTLETPKETTTTSTASEVEPVLFTAHALGGEFIGLDSKPINFEQILDVVHGNVALIDLWATWCPDCIKAFPETQKIQEEFPDVSFVYLSLDKTEKSWKDGIAKHKLNGNHYLLQDDKGMKGDFGQAIGLNWIPRYIIVDKTSRIALYDATEKSYAQIRETLKKLQ